MLVSVDDLKTYLGVSGSTYDDFLESQCKVISDTIEAYCRRKFNVTSFEQTFYSTENERSCSMTLFAFPVVTLTSIEEDGVVLDSSKYRIHKPTGRILRTDGLFFCAKETVVTYTAGFSTIPSPVQSVVYSLIQERYNKKSSGVALDFGSDVQRISIPGTISIDFDYSLSNNDRKTPFGTILGSQLNVLDFYRSDRSILPSDKIEWVEET